MAKGWHKEEESKIIISRTDEVDMYYLSLNKHIREANGDAKGVFALLNVISKWAGRDFHCLQCESNIPS